MNGSSLLCALVNAQHTLQRENARALRDAAPTTLSPRQDRRIEDDARQKEDPDLTCLCNATYLDT
jgi:hypothetical protein